MEQRQHLHGDDELLPIGRFRQVPDGFVGLRADLGARLRERRKDGYGKQATVATDIGIAPETLSRIENGSAVPRLETLDALLAVLELDWSHVAIRSREDCGQTNLTSRRRDRLLDAGREIRDARRHAGMSLRELSGFSGLSLAHLSRIEHGGSGGRRVYTDHPDDVGLPRDERRIVIRNIALKTLVARFHDAEPSG